jgi:diguanylate cyclase (GGDEF)-like protein
MDSGPQQGELDPLLGIGHRGKFDQDLAGMAKVGASQNPTSLIMVDLDHFKQINDNYGHPVGDIVLKLVAATIKSVCEGKGTCYRYGGEEIAVLLPNFSLAEAKALAERIRSSISTADCQPVRETVTASLGVAACPETSPDAAQLLADADKALYRAKRDGRNRVQAASQFAGRGQIDSSEFCSSSSMCMLQDFDSPITLYLPVVEATWGEHEVRLIVQPEDAADMAALDGLRRGSKRLLASYLHNIAVCGLVDVVHLTKGSTRLWELKLNVQLEDFTPTVEMAFSELSGDQLAEIRARRILLNESPAEESEDVNKIAREIFVRGFQTLSQPERSPFPQLYQVFGRESRRFLEIAWICAVTVLKLSATVAEVSRLELSLREVWLGVSFHGRRKKIYQNRPAHEIAFDGACLLGEHSVTP